MDGFAAHPSLLLVIVVSMVVVRVATVALTLTGLSQQLARFQARSAFSGAGFTTAESEKVTQHPVRRRIIMLLMLLGNAGIVTAVSSLILSFISTADDGASHLGLRLGLLAVGLACLWRLAHSTWLDQRVTLVIKQLLEKYTELDVRDYCGLLHLSRGYRVAELEVERNDWLAERPLGELRLSEEGVLVLGVERRDGSYLGAPRGQPSLVAGDTVIMYGPSERIQELDYRRAGSEGNWRHHKAVDRQHRVELAETPEPFPQFPLESNV